MVNKAIPLTPDCEIKRKAEIERRATLRIEIETLVRELKPYEPRTQLK